VCSSDLSSLSFFSKKKHKKKYTHQIPFFINYKYIHKSNRLEN